jgi:CheY-like chemotaxis protein
MKRVFLIDDDPIFIHLARKIIGTIDNTLLIDVFSDGELAIGHINAVKNDASALPEFIFLDLNMPVLDGWGFLEAYSAMRDKLDKNIELYILSSTISADDIARALAYPVTKGFLIKPLDKAKMEEILLSIE